MNVELSIPLHPSLNGEMKTALEIKKFHVETNADKMIRRTRQTCKTEYIGV